MGLVAFVSLISDSIRSDLLFRERERVPDFISNDYQLCFIKGIVFVIYMRLRQHGKEKRINLRPFDGMQITCVNRTKFVEFT